VTGGMAPRRPLSKRHLTAAALDSLGLTRLVRSHAAWTGQVCLTYHRIGDPSGSLFDHEIWSATAEGFDAQLRFVRREFDVILPRDLADARRSKRGRHVLITFDDGYRDNYEVAFPILQAHSLKATFFVSTGFIDNPRLPWWDEIAWMVNTSTCPMLAGIATPLSLAAADRPATIRTLLDIYKRLSPDETSPFLEGIAHATGSGRFTGDASSMWMTWPMLRAMQAAGMEIGGHTVTHPVLGRLPVADQAREIRQCVARLESQLSRRIGSFSYPIGSRSAFDGETRKCAADAGLDHAFSFYGGYSGPGAWDPYDVPRVGVELELEATPQLFRAMLSLPAVFCTAERDAR
jgi:peptidoglycan/xylan/chitin deacetylase (PgdA/CDA1 family)